MKVSPTFYMSLFHAIECKEHEKESHCWDVHGVSLRHVSQQQKKHQHAGAGVASTAWLEYVMYVVDWRSGTRCNIKPLF